MRERLKRRFERRHLLHFVGVFGVFVFTASTGVIRSQHGWYLLGLPAYCLIFFELWEMRIVCSRCLFHAERGKTLRCMAGQGSLKLWAYRPEPMKRREKIRLWVGFAVLGG